MPGKVVTADWGPLLVVLPGVCVLAVGAIQLLEGGIFLAGSAQATAVISAMEEKPTPAGYQLCYATADFPSGVERTRVVLSLGGYWPETGGGCAEVGDDLEVRYSLADPMDARAAGRIWQRAREFLTFGLLLSVPSLGWGLFALRDWWSRRSSRIRAAPSI
jgi:hypothetical protein